MREENGITIIETAEDLLAVFGKPRKTNIFLDLLRKDYNPAFGPTMRVVRVHDDQPDFTATPNGLIFPKEDGV